jgi:predicted metal-dependent HD superfamily phosphohydrolase
MNSVMKAWGDLPPIFADRLMALLCAPGRLTHGLHRVNQLLIEADRACHPHWLRPLRWAVLYRTAVYDPLSPPGENQRASAELWLEHFPAIFETVRGVSGSWEQEVAAVIEAVAVPFERPESFLPWQHALLDLSLGWLGEPKGLYAARRVFQAAAYEAAGGEPGDWLRLRRDFLEQALACPRLYDCVYMEREAQARENARRELGRM